MAETVARFENLGTDAEFAIVQRHCGVRACGVLAYAHSVGIGDLIRLLDVAFAGFCDPDHLSLVGPGLLRDRRYDVRMPMVAPAPTSDAALFDVLLHAHARVQAMAAVTLARLAAGDTIFVFKAPVTTDAHALHASLRRFGDNALLLVQPGSAPTATTIEPGLYAGTISAFAQGDAVLHGIHVAEWETLCRATWRLHAPPRPAGPRAIPVVQPPPPIPDAASHLSNAVRLHRDGDLAAAAVAYKALLLAEPDHADALHLLGLVHDAQGEAEQALGLIDQAIAQKASPRFFANRGLILARLGRLDDAIAAYREALARQSDYAEALNNFGVALTAQEKYAEAAETLRHAVAVRPDYAEAHLNLGHAIGLLGDIEGAEAAFRRAFARKPALRPALIERTLLCVAADAGMPGAIYRCAHRVDAAIAAGWSARWLALADVQESDLRGLQALLFWRGELTGPVCRMVAYARACDTRIGLDLDDLICVPRLARIATIDGIRTLGTTETRARAQFGRVRALLQTADFAIASTDELATHMREAGPPVWVLPNGFDAATLHTARAAVRAHARPDDVVRLGYAGGTRTHQRDIGPIAPALAAVLRARPNARLVLFRAPDGEPMVALDEFPDLAALADRIEWRDLVPHRVLPRELARFNINLAPVERGNPFAEAKSELKYFEAALAGVPTVATPAGPFSRAIRHGDTGLLADTADDWTATLLGLIDNPAQRARLAQAAYHDALWRFGPQLRAMRTEAMLTELGGGAAAARAFAADALPTRAAAATPTVPAATVLFESDDGRDSRITVLIICDTDVIRALGSVRAQTLADIDLVVIDDGAAAATAERTLAWLHGELRRFHRVALHRAADGARNLGFAWAETPWVLPLASDQVLRPTAAASLLAAAEHADAAFSFTATNDRGMRYEPRRLHSSKGPGTPVLLAKWAWAAAGGDDAEDDDLGIFRRLAELGLHGVAAAP